MSLEENLSNIHYCSYKYFQQMYVYIFYYHEVDSKTKGDTQTCARLVLYSILGLIFRDLTRMVDIATIFFYKHFFLRFHLNHIKIDGIVMLLLCQW